MAISDNFKEILNRMNRRAEKVQLGTIIQNLELGVVAEGSISTAELADEAVDNDKLADDAVDTDQIADGAVENDQLGADAVDGAKIADNAVSLEHLDSGIAPVFIAIEAEDAKTTSVEENVAGLSSCITLANDLKSVVNVHYADIGSGAEEHVDPSTVSDAIASDDADDLASLVTLLSEVQDSYVAHDADAALGSPADHQAQTSANSLASAVNPTTLAECITVANDISAKLDLHMADSTSHSSGDSPSVAESDAANGAAILVSEANVEVGDVVSWSILDDGTNNVTGVSAVAASAGITFTFSGDPGADAIISYCVFRAAS